MNSIIQNSGNNSNRHAIMSLATHLLKKISGHLVVIIVVVLSVIIIKS